MCCYESFMYSPIVHAQDMIMPYCACYSIQIILYCNEASVGEISPCTLNYFSSRIVDVHFLQSPVTYHIGS